ncbi:MAG: formyltransferase domain-containing protein [Burkholderiales bacterium]|nr:formyltransferase domain-containing protein [Burkholderiales bacterium]
MRDDRFRVAMFGSFYRGFYLLNELLQGDISEQVTVVGVATDDPEASYVSADKRVWQYPHTVYEKVMVSELAKERGIDTFNGKVNDPEFYEVIDQWKPDICVMATFGQRIRSRLINTPKLGFYNLHPCIDDSWPSHYVGGNPFEGLMRDGKRYANIAFHAVDEGFDTGPLLGLSGKIALPKETSVTDMHKITSYSAAQLASKEMKKIFAAHQNSCKKAL